MLINDNNPHGGDIYTNDVTLDFSSNVNPYGIPEAVKRAAAEAIANCSSYPDPYCRTLREKLSEREKLPSEMILCGNGAVELIYSFCYSLPKDKPALIVSPTFCEYESALSAAGIEIEYYFLSEQNGFTLDENVLKTDLSRYGALFLCSPNNPTGKTVYPELLRRLAGTGVRLFVDMCFIDLTDSFEKRQTAEFVLSYPNVVILKAFTKNLAVPGLRLGYALCSDSDFMNEMARKAPCWNVSVPAQAAGCAALECEEWLSDTVKTISMERKRLTDALRSLGIKVFEGEANYLLLYSEVDLFDRLLSLGILVRDCSNYRGLKKGFFRIAVRLPEENDRLLSVLKEVLR